MLKTVIMEYPKSTMPLGTRIFGVDEVKNPEVLILNLKYQYES